MAALLDSANGPPAEVTVCVPLFNYKAYILETLDSIRAQDLQALELIVVDDCSTDGSSEVVLPWMNAHAERFRRVALLRPAVNGGLARSRNLALEAARTEFVYMLDADDLIYPRCLSRSLQALKAGGASVAHTMIECFEGEHSVIGFESWDPPRFVPGNVVGAMALLRRDHLLSVGGYDCSLRTGFEDYDLWCRFVEHGYYGVQVPELLVRYRVHGDSMLNAFSHNRQNIGQFVGWLKARHPWLKVDWMIPAHGGSQ